MTDGSYKTRSSGVTYNPSDKGHYPNGDHSGIVYQVNNTPENTSHAQRIRIRSKWGSGGLYEHQGNHSPYNSSGLKFYYR